MDTVSPGSFAERMLRRASTSRVSFRQNTLLKSLDNKNNSINNNDNLADVSAVSSLTAAINDINNDIDALGIPCDINKKTPTRKQSKYKKISSTGTPDSFNEKRIRRTSSRVSNSKRILFNTNDSDIEVDENSDYQFNDSLMSSLSAALKDLDDECDALGIFPADNLKKPIDEIYLSENSIDNNINKIKNIKDITETPKSCHGKRPNLESTRKSLTFVNPNDVTRTSSIDALSPILPKSPGGNIVPNGNCSVYNKSLLSHDVASALDTLEDVIDDNMSAASIDAQSYKPSITSTNKKTFFKRITNRFSGRYQHNHSECKIGENSKISDNNSAVIRTAKLYRTFSQRIKKGLRNSWSRRESSTNNMSPEIIDKLTCSKKKIEEIDKLLLKIKIEKVSINQAKKALIHCHLNSELFGSKEKIESERILLRAGIKKRLLNEKLKQLYDKQNDSIDNIDINQINSYADVKIDKICLTLKKILDKNLTNGDIADWFVIVITEGCNVWVSLPVTCEVGNPFIEFTNFTIKMSKLLPNLKIIIEVYNLKLKTERAYDDIINHYNNHSDKLLICPSPKKLFKKNEQQNIPKVLNIKNNNNDNNDDIKTSFKLSGRIVIDVKDLNLSSPWSLIGVPHDSILLGTVHFDLTPTINIAVCHKGFLTQCSEVNGIPTRDVRWCVLKGRTLSLWKYQDDEEFKTPLIEIDLVDCYTKNIQVTSETLCAKPKTILIETMRKRKPDDRDSMVIECRNNYTIVRYFLSCDTKKDLDEWIDKLNFAILLVREWDDSVPHSPTNGPLVSDL